MRQRQTTLANGLRVVTAEMPDSHSVTASIAVGTGSRYEQYSKNGGVSHFLEHVLFKGTKRYPSPEAISQAIDAVGGTTNAFTSSDITDYYIKVPARHRQLPLKILADMVARPLLVPSEINRERRVVIEEMNILRDNPARLIQMLVPELLFPDNPLGHDTIGSEEVINHITPRAIRSYVETHYRPGNMVVSVAGRLKHDEVVTQASTLLGNLSVGETPEFVPIGPKPSSKLVSSRVKDINQTHLMLVSRAYRYGDPRSVIADVMSAVLGRGPSSRLFMSVRERQGLAYSISCDMACYVDTGLHEIYAGVNLDKTEQALDSIWEKLKRLRNELVDRKELRKAKEQLCAALEMDAENNLNVAEELGLQLVLYDEIKSISRQ